MATAASFTNHFVTLFISFALLQYAIYRYAMDPTVVGAEYAIDYFPPNLPHDQLSQRVLDWEKRGQYVTVADGLRVFAVDIPCTGDSTACATNGILLVLHGFPSSSYDYAQTADALARHFRVVLFDWIGFGLSSKPPASNFSYALMEQADVALQVWQQLLLVHDDRAGRQQAAGRNGERDDDDDVPPLHLMAHDMGDTIAQELLARKARAALPKWFAHHLHSVTLNNGGIIAELHTPRISQLLLRVPLLGRWFASLMNYPLFRRQLRTILAAPDTFPEHELEDMYALVSVGGGHRVTADLIGYIGERYRFSASRWLPALVQETVKVHLIWGAADTVAPVEIAHRIQALAPHVQVTLLPNAGHFAMIETPDDWVNAVLSHTAFGIKP